MGGGSSPRILRNAAYIGRTEAVPDRCVAGKTRQVQRLRDQWIAIAVPAILNDELVRAVRSAECS